MVADDNAKIVAGCVQNDPQAWSLFVNRFAPFIRKMIKKTVSKYRGFDRTECEDILQEVLIVLWRKRKLSQLRECNKVYGYLAVITRGVAIDHFRKYRLRFTYKTKEIPFDEELLNTLPESRDPFYEIEKGERLSRIERSFKFLTQNESRALRLSITGDRTHQEIAQHLSLPLNTISSLIRRGKQKVRRRVSVDFE